MSMQSWSEVINAAGASGAAVASTASETIIIPDFTLPANFLYPKRTLWLRVFGQYSNTSTPTLTFAVRWGGVAGTLLCTSAAITTPSGVTAACWEIDVMIQCRSDGASGTVMANGNAKVYAAVAPTVASTTGAAAVTPMTKGGVITPATASVDTTASAALSATVTWSASSASNTATALNWILMSAN